MSLTGLQQQAVDAVCAGEKKKFEAILLIGATVDFEFKSIFADKMADYITRVYSVLFEARAAMDKTPEVLERKEPQKYNLMLARETVATTSELPEGFTIIKVIGEYGNIRYAYGRRGMANVLYLDSESQREFERLPFPREMGAKVPVDRGLITQKMIHDMSAKENNEIIKSLPQALDEAANAVLQAAMSALEKDLEHTTHIPRAAHEFLRASLKSALEKSIGLEKPTRITAEDLDRKIKIFEDKKQRFAEINHDERCACDLIEQAVIQWRTQENMKLIQTRCQSVVIRHDDLPFDVNFRTESGETLLHLVVQAVSESKLSQKAGAKLIRMLMDMRINPLDEDRQRKSALQLARDAKLPNLSIVLSGGQEGGLDDDRIRLDSYIEQCKVMPGKCDAAKEVLCDGSREKEEHERRIVEARTALEEIVQLNILMKVIQDVKLAVSRYGAVSVAPLEAVGGFGRIIDLSYSSSSYSSEGQTRVQSASALIRTSEDIGKIICQGFEGLEINLEELIGDGLVTMTKDYSTLGILQDGGEELRALIEIIVARVNSRLNVERNKLLSEPKHTIEEVERALEEIVEKYIKDRNYLKDFLESKVAILDGHQEKLKTLMDGRPERFAKATKGRVELGAYAAKPANLSIELYKSKQARAAGHKKLMEYAFEHSRLDMVEMVLAAGGTLPDDECLMHIRNSALFGRASLRTLVLPGLIGGWPYAESRATVSFNFANMRKLVKILQDEAADEKFIDEFPKDENSRKTVALIKELVEVERKYLAETLDRIWYTEHDILAKVDDIEDRLLGGIRIIRACREAFTAKNIDIAMRTVELYCNSARYGSFESKSIQISGFREVLVKSKKNAEDLLEFSRAQGAPKSPGSAGFWSGSRKAALSSLSYEAGVKDGERKGQATLGEVSARAERAETKAERTAKEFGEFRERMERYMREQTESRHREEKQPEEESGSRHEA